MQIFNTLTRRKEEFVPGEPGVYRIYVCGPTVYNYIHIGNARPMIVFDTLRRYLEYRGNKVIYVSNITDIDDKLIAKGQAEGVSMDAVARRFEAVGYKIFATKGTARTLKAHGVKALEIRKLEQESPNILDLVLGHQIDLIIDIPAQGAEHGKDGLVIRRNAIETGVHVLTSLDTANALATSLENRAKELTLIDIAQVKNA